MATYMVNMSNVQAVADEMASIANYIQEMLTDLDSETKKHLAEWDSNSRSAYDTAKKKWDNAAANMVLQAQKAQANLSSINDNYALAEYQGLGLWGQ
jgi:WXG100 family type VII secretion target